MRTGGIAAHIPDCLKHNDYYMYHCFHVKDLGILSTESASEFRRLPD